MWCAAAGACARTNPAYLADESGGSGEAATGSQSEGATEPGRDGSGETGPRLDGDGDGDTGSSGDSADTGDPDAGKSDSDGETTTGDVVDRCGLRLAVGGTVPVSDDTFVVSAEQEECEVADLCDDLNFGQTSEFAIGDDGPGDMGVYRSYLLLRFELGPVDLTELWEASISIHIAEEDLKAAAPLEFAAFAMDDPDWAPGTGDAELAIKGEATWEHALTPARWGDTGDFAATLGVPVGAVNVADPMPGDIVDIPLDDPEALLLGLDDGALNIAVTVLGRRLSVLASESDDAPELWFEGCGAR